MTTAKMLRREGETRGKREALLLLLRQRFGRLPAAAVARIDKAAVVELDLWFSQVLMASSFEAVLCEGRCAAAAPDDAPSLASLGTAPGGSAGSRWADLGVSHRIALAQPSRGPSV